MRRIYLDHAATTPLAPEARAAMEPWLGREYGNPSSLYEEGRRARQAIDEAREAISRSLGCLFGEVVFTSSGTEAANLALVGTALARSRDGNRNRVLIGAAEHHCVLHTAKLLEGLGVAVELLPVDRMARVRLEALEERMADDVLLVAAMHANNELGTVQDVAAISTLCRRQGALLFVDAVQTYLSGIVPVDVDSLGADLVAVSAHKVYGPKGTGALYIRSGTQIEPTQTGGGQEREMRAGTENVAGIVGFSAAVRTGRPLIDDACKQMARDTFLQSLTGHMPSVDFRSGVLPGHCHIRFPGHGAESLLIVLDRLGVSASSGAACSSGSLEPSHVMLAAGYTSEEAGEGLRFTFGRHSTVEEAKDAASQVLTAVAQVSAGGRNRARR